MAICIRNLTANKTYTLKEEPSSNNPPSFFQKIVNIVTGVLVSPKTADPSPKKGFTPTSFRKGAEAFLAFQKSLQTASKKTALEKKLFEIKETKIEESTLQKVLRCANYLEGLTRPGTKTTCFKRYKINEISFTLHWKNKKLVSLFLHFKKKTNTTQKPAGTFSQVTKAVELFPQSFRLLAESCNIRKEKYRPDWLDYESEHVLKRPFYFPYSYKGHRTSSTNPTKKEAVFKKVIFTEFLEMDLWDYSNTFVIKSKDRLKELLISIAKGLKAIHKHHALKDLKRENIMLSFEKTKLAKIKIIDLPNIHAETNEEAWEGTRDYWPFHEEGLAPLEPQSLETDIYAFGHLMQELEEQSVPVFSNEPSFKLQYEDLINSCKKESAEERPKIAEVIQRLEQIFS